MKSRDRRAERILEFVTNMFQYNVTVGITRSEVIFLFVKVMVSPLVLYLYFISSTFHNIMVSPLPFYFNFIPSYF